MAAPAINMSYEFSAEQNRVFTGLGNSMGWMGSLFTLVGFLNLVIAGLLFAVIYQSSLPADVLSKIPEEVKAQVSKLPEGPELKVVAAAGLLNGIIIFMVGIWTWSASGSYLKIAKTQKQDISHLMDALQSQRAMYRLVFNLLFVGVLVLVGLTGYLGYEHFMVQ
jgi:hypothetical protein